MVIRRQATAGMVADTSLYNIDGACVTNGGITRNVGTAVGVLKTGVGAQSLVDGHKVLIAPATGNVYGVLVKSHYDSPKGTYGGAAGDVDNFSVANVMTHGRIWMVTSLTAAPEFGSAVSVSPGDGSVSASDAAGAIATNWTFAGGYQAAAPAQGEQFALVEVQVIQK